MCIRDRLEAVASTAPTNSSRWGDQSRITTGARVPRSTRRRCRRTDLLIPPGTEGDTFSASRLLAAVTARPGAASARRRSGQRSCQDPIAHWIDQDCWRPPSAPTHTYRGSRYDRARAPKADAGAHDRHDRSARWFSWKRTGGKTMLFHRTLAPVVIRDWSPHL